MERQFRVEIDAELVANATNELYACLLARNLAYIDRWYSHALIKKLKLALRNIALILSAMGLLLPSVIK